MLVADYRQVPDLEAQTRLASLELGSNSEQERASARTKLEAFASNGKYAPLALRALTRDALRRRDLPTALAWSERNAAMPKAEFSDQLLRLEALFLAESPEYESWLSTVEKSAEQDPRFAFELGKWELAALDPNKAASWLESLPKNVRDKPLLGVLLADSYGALQRWTELESLVRWANWRELEPLRLAFLARAQSRLGNAQKSDHTWELALTGAESQPGQAIPLLAMAREENRDVRKLLWMIVERDPRQVWARKELYESYFREKNSDQMLRMMELTLKENPSDQTAKYNVAGLLMVTGREIPRAERLAKELYEADSRNLERTALYAYGLKLQGEREKAAKMLDGRRQDLDQLGNEGKAFYALILFDCGRRDEAFRVAEDVNRQELLPELRTSLDQVSKSASPAG